jgi:thioredoxin reductase (NADPH)
MIETDVVIVGAGPCGIFQVFELGLLGLQAHVLDSLPKVGGQCAELYPDKPIYDIPGLPSILAGKLIDNLMEQIEPFGATFHLGQTVETVDRRAENDFLVTTSKGTEFACKAVIIAGGLGNFQPRKMSVRGVGNYEGSQIFYKVADKTAHYGKDLVILGGGDSALDWALELYDKANSVLLVHRSQKFKAATASVNKMLELSREHEMLFMEGTVKGIVEDEDNGRMKALRIATPQGVTRTVECDEVLIFWGLSPKLGPIAKWGLGLHRAQIEVDTEKFETTVPGIYAVGDINWYPGKKKLILSGFHEAALAAFAIKGALNPDEKVFLQYTTTSPAMHKRLGVDDPFKELLED